MSAAARFKQSDVKRAVKGAMDAGIRVGRVLIDPLGNIIVETDTAPTQHRKPSKLDRIL